MPDHPALPGVPDIYARITSHQQNIPHEPQRHTVNYMVNTNTWCPENSSTPK